MFSLTIQHYQQEHNFSHSSVSFLRSFFFTCDIQLAAKGCWSSLMVNLKGQINVKC